MLQLYVRVYHVDKGVYTTAIMENIWQHTAKPADQQGREKKGKPSKLLGGGMQAALGFTGFHLLSCLTVARKRVRRGYKLSVSRRGWMKIEQYVSLCKWEGSEVAEWHAELPCSVLISGKDQLNQISILYWVLNNMVPLAYCGSNSL